MATAAPFKRFLCVAAMSLFAGALVCTPRASAEEFTLDISGYAYEETTDSGAFFMSDESAPTFFSAGLRDWNLPDQNEKFGLLYTGEFTYGKVDYFSSSGTLTKNYYKGRVEGYAAYQVNKQFSPFIGLGYRHLFDASGGSQTATGALGYDRLSQYLYAPIGARIEPIDKLSFKIQYNLFLHGKQTSYLSTASSAFGDVINDQNSGWGTDFAVNYQITNKWSTYGFYRHWDIEKSETSTGTIAGVIAFTAEEPKNTTDEIGIGIAYRF